jgi:hypothetical protein
MRALTPWTGLSTTKKRWTRLLDRFWDEDALRFPRWVTGPPPWTCPRRRTRVMVKAEVPGME